jgi:YD repeat-containing protein
VGAKEALSVEQQVEHPGLVWFDRLSANSCDRYGFGAEVRKAIAKRREALRPFGIQPSDPTGAERLRELERRNVAKDFGARTRQVFVESIPATFRGRAELAGTSFPASGYFAVSDGAAFVLVRETSSLRAAQGQTVTLGRDAQGRVVARTDRSRGIGL